MAAKKSRTRPEKDVGFLTKYDEPRISKKALGRFLKYVRAKNPKAKVKFVARNAPFMRRPPS